MSTAPELHRTLDLEGFLRVVHRVYAAGCAETSWDQAVEEVCRVGDFDGGALSSIDPVERQPLLRARHGLSDRAATGGGLRGMPGNPLLTDEVLRSPPGTVWDDRRVMPPRAARDHALLDPVDAAQRLCLMGLRDRWQGAAAK